MIKTSRQLKALVSNQAKGDSGKSQLLIRNYAMERFLERLSLSDYRSNFVLKGGMLVASLVGLDNRATMDIDTTVCDLPLDCESAEKIVQDILSVSLEDNIFFNIRKVTEIMDDAEYSGVRLSLDAHLDTTHIPLKIDISTGDVITPGSIVYAYRLMFEDRDISVLAYPVETVIAEKIETILSRGLTNTRMRDFYDLYALQKCAAGIDSCILNEALCATCSKRDSEHVLKEYPYILDSLRKSGGMQKQWYNYQRKNTYAEGITWDTVMSVVNVFCAETVQMRETPEVQRPMMTLH